MKHLFNLSLRYKLPLFGGGLIIVATFAVSATLMVQIYDDLRNDLLNTSVSLGRTLAINIFPLMLNDDVWRTFELLRAPLFSQSVGNLVRPEMIFVLDPQQQVFASTQPNTAPTLVKLDQLGEDYARLSELIAASPAPEAATVTLAGHHRLYVAVPIADDGVRPGTLIIVHSKDVFLPRFFSIAWRAALMGLLVLGILFPLSWYWGRRMANPLVQLAHSIEGVALGGGRTPLTLSYSYGDELGQLIEAYAVMVQSLRDKDRLEQAMIRSERLAAIGRLSSGIAHEINNPLGGMFVALDNFKRHGGHDERTLKTMAMIERGLAQIRETVSAILIEVKVKSRAFDPQDIKDFDTLLAGEVSKRAVSLHIGSDLDGSVSLPATMVRQILMNLLLNALQASEPSGTVHCRIQHIGGEKLVINIENTGCAIPDKVMDHLFEPFASGKENGAGLGLWVTYQIVSQLRGQISVESREGLTRFVVTLPTGEPS